MNTDKSMTETVVHSARLISPGIDGEQCDIEDAWVHMRGGVIVAMGVGDAWRRNVAANATVIDALSTIGQGAIVTPGLLTSTATAEAATASTGRRTRSPQLPALISGTA